MIVSLYLAGLRIRNQFRLSVSPGVWNSVWEECVAPWDVGGLAGAFFELFSALAICHNFIINEFFLPLRSECSRLRFVSCEWVSVCYVLAERLLLFGRSQRRDLYSKYLPLSVAYAHSTPPPPNTRINLVGTLSIWCRIISEKIEWELVIHRHLFCCDLGRSIDCPWTRNYFVDNGVQLEIRILLRFLCGAAFFRRIERPRLCLSVCLATDTSADGLGGEIES